MLKKIDWILIFAVVLGAVLRSVWLNRLPIGFTPDEAALGYSAYSLLQTGRDEWGTSWWKLPFTNLRSFGDYKPPLYPMVAIPFIKLFGLNEFAVRLPSAVFGTLAIISVYLLCSVLFTSETVKIFRSYKISPSQIAAVIFAISPWSISLSRIALEANLVTFFLPLAIYFFLINRYIFSAVIFALDIYSYHSARVITPFIILLLPLLKKVSAKSRIFVAAACLIILSLPALLSYMGVGSGRLSDVGIFNPTDNWSAVSDRRFAATIQGLPDSVSRVFSNKFVYFVSQFVHSLLGYLSVEFLFTTGAGESTYGMISGRGVLYLMELPLLAAFLISFIRKFNRQKLFLVLAVIVSAVPAALSKSVGFSANRAAPMLPFLSIMLSLGLITLYKNLTKSVWLFSTALILGYTLSLCFFMEDYIYHSPRSSAPAMSYGWKEALTRAAPMFDRFSEIRFSRSLSEPQVFAAFYLRIDPREYQAASANWADFNVKGFRFLDQYDGYRLGKFRFGNINASEPVNVPTLYFGRPEDFPINTPEFFHIDFPNGQTAIKVSSKNPNL
jgi:4-amino-4-deoxy-L-arabinose transferase-like glycosyltransferase